MSDDNQPVYSERFTRITDFEQAAVLAQANWTLRVEEGSGQSIQTDPDAFVINLANSIAASPDRVADAVRQRNLELTRPAIG